ncbi:MAG: peptidoglycan DD-metalloendopeptidase family protein [Oscillospiraceae bacterium]|nr:peptidoglycan DD-metalloendopeptidase family protein [Oscillospiraceae bacterium]
MEENGGYNILALIFQAENYADLLTAFDDMGEIMQSDKLLQKQYEAARAETEEIKAKFEAEKAVYEGDQAVLREEKEKLEADIKESEERLEKLASEIEKAIADYEAAEAAEESAAATIANLIKQNELIKAQERAAVQAEAKRQIEEMTAANAEAAANGEAAPYSEEQLRQTAEVAEIGYVSSNSGFTWPLPCSTRISSSYGTRTDPFTGATSTHNGLDIDGFGNDGAPVVAAAAGTVTTAAYDSSYGNYVVIDHGGTSTVYAHMSSLSVSAGQSVSQGQTIGAVGSTGRATGTHLHFEVYEGGSRVDPAQYFSGMSYYG